MSNIFQIVIVFLAGIVLGIFFYGGLWYTIKKAMPSKIPALWFSGSFILRISVTLLGFYFVAAGNVQSLLSCTFGFILSRFIVSYVTKQKNLNVLSEES